MKYKELLEDHQDDYDLINQLPYLAIVEGLGEVNKTLARIADALEPCPRCVNCCAPKEKEEVEDYPIDDGGCKIDEEDL